MIFVNLVNIRLQKVQRNHQNQKLESLNLSKWQILHFFEFLYLIHVKSEMLNHSVEISGFSVTQILREINFVDSRSAKTAVFDILGSVNFVHFDRFLPRKIAIKS